MQSGRRRGGGRVIDMVISLAVLLVPVLIIMAIFTVPPDKPVAEAVDWQPVVEQARAGAKFEVMAPRALPDDWIATRARWAPAGQAGVDGRPVPADTLQLGFIDPQPLYFGLDQSSAPAAPFIAKVTRSGRFDGQSVVGGRTWHRYVSEDGRTRALVLSDAASTVVLTADGSYEALEAFAGTLGPA